MYISSRPTVGGDMTSAARGHVRWDLADAADKGTFVLEKWLLAFCQHKMGSMQLSKKERRKGYPGPYCHSGLLGVVLVVFGLPWPELRTLARRKLDGSFREALLKIRPPQTDSDREERSRKRRVQGEGEALAEVWWRRGCCPSQHFFPSLVPNACCRTTHPAEVTCRLFWQGI